MRRRLAASSAPLRAMSRPAALVPELTLGVRSTRAMSLLDRTTELDRRLARREERQHHPSTCRTFPAWAATRLENDTTMVFIRESPSTSSFTPPLSSVLCESCLCIVDVGARRAGRRGRVGIRVAGLLFCPGTSARRCARPETIRFRSSVPFVFRLSTIVAGCKPECESQWTVGGAGPVLQGWHAWLGGGVWDFCLCSRVPRAMCSVHRGKHLQWGHR